ncbi:MAG TPA: prolyl oligopeptidase family serine peptidase, partial [Acidobacteriota bacterium]|nr:prolyl oligopeptidase family serine peptidase [Acidobacteriota bacterium]
YRYWSERVGDMEDSATQERLARVSPLNLAAEIKAPVLLVHGKEDYNVPLDQAQKMAAALERAGHPPRTLYFAGLGHAFPVGEDGARFLKEIEQFLAANLAEGAAPAKPTAAAQAASQRP